MEYNQAPAPAPHYHEQSICMRSFFLDAGQDNKEPIPQPEDYAPDPVYPQDMMSMLRGYPPENSTANWFNYIGISRIDEPFRGLRSPLGLSSIKVEAEQLLKEEQDVPREPPAEPDKPDRMIGGITASERRQKISLYLEKRRKRSFAKKVAYDCRKKVADQRIRVKGRFVTRTQALSLLNLPEGDYPEELIKRLLTEKLPKKSQNHPQ